MVVLTGFGALWPLAAGVAQAQAPSGPITATPTQPAPGPVPNASTPAPAAPPRTTILGVWKFNADDSDDPRKRTQDSRDSNGGYGGGPGRLGGGDPGGGHPGGGGPPGGVGKRRETREKRSPVYPP